MKRILALILCLLLATTPAYGDAESPAGATSVCFDVFVSDSSSSTGAGLTGLVYNSGSLTCYYHRRGASSATSISLASSTLGTYTSGAFKEISSSNMPGQYEFCVPDAALAIGATDVMFECKGATNMAPMNLRVNLKSANSFGFDGKLASESGTTLGLATGGVDADDQFNVGFAIVVFDSAGLVSARSCIVDSTNSGDTIVTAEDITALIAVADNYIIQPDAGCSGNVTRWAGTTVAAPDTAGYVKATVKSGTGTGELALTAGVVNADMTKISTDATAADNLEAAFDGAGYAGGTIKQNVNVSSIDNSVITSAKFASGAVNAAAVNTDLKGATYNSSTDTLEQIRDNTALQVTLQSGSVDAATVTSAAANKIADHMLRRSTANIEGSSDGDTLSFKSLYGAIAKQSHCIAVAGNTLTIKKSDCSTTLDTQSVTTSSGASPITGLGSN